MRSSLLDREAERTQEPDGVNRVPLAIALSSSAVIEQASGMCPEASTKHLPNPSSMLIEQVDSRTLTPTQQIITQPSLESVRHHATSHPNQKHPVAIPESIRH